MSTSSPFIKGIFFFLFLKKTKTSFMGKTNKSPNIFSSLPFLISKTFKKPKTRQDQTMQQLCLKYFVVTNNVKKKPLIKNFKASGGATVISIPPAFGMTGNVMLEAVLFNLQHVVEGSIQLLNSHFYGALYKYIPIIYLFYILNIYYNVYII